MALAKEKYERLIALHYSEEDIARIGDIDRVEDIRDVLTRYGYDDGWRTSYGVRSVRASLHASKITCIDAAILAYGLLDLFPDTERYLLAIHRRGEGEECGHVVTLFREPGARFGAFSKSSYTGLAHRDPIFADPHAVARSLAEAYVHMGFEPLYYGSTKLESIAGDDVDWRFATGDISVLSARLVASYEYAFDVAPVRALLGGAA